MKKFIILLFSIFVVSFLPVFAKENNSNKSIVIKNSLFSITLPNEIKGSYYKKVSKDRICIFDKQSKKAGFGGFAFGIKGYKNPADHAFLPGSKKLGELTDKKGELYDIVIKYPTDVQYDYTKYSNMPHSYEILYNLGDKISINGIKGTKYFKNQGTKGQNLYNDILKKHQTAINEKWDSIRLEQENMSPMYNLTDKIGYVYYDVNVDGIDELLIGEIAQGAWKGIIFDMYTMVNRKPQHVFSGWDRNRYYVCNNVFICNEYSSGAAESGVNVYILTENSTELFPQLSFKYDGYKNSQKPWFISYGIENNEDKWENVSEEFFNERKQTFDNYQRFDYIPLSKFKY